MPSVMVTQLETAEPGWIDTRLLYVSSWLDTRLAKRYDAPFSLPYPIAILDWLTAIVTHECWLKRGISPTDEEAAEYKDRAVVAKAEVFEAANSEVGLFELPLRNDTNAAGVARGFPRGVSQMSPYVAFDEQAYIGHQEDSQS
jgi:hypothetical protein